MTGNPRPTTDDPRPAAKRPRDPRHLPRLEPRRRGAQPGNFNALKHGRRSRRYLATARTLADDPVLFDVLRAFAHLARNARPAAGLRTNRKNASGAEAKKIKNATNEFYA